uniref:Uncharacterized protein n=1 Tax=Triticum urartu TaxID=4572 RepID=A0A8R7UPP4_TRIUA
AHYSFPTRRRLQPSRVVPSPFPAPAPARQISSAVPTGALPRARRQAEASRRLRRWRRRRRIWTRCSSARATATSGTPTSPTPSRPTSRTAACRSGGKRSSTPNPVPSISGSLFGPPSPLDLRRIARVFRELG